LLALSTKTSQLVFTAKESDVPAIGASTGSPSNTTRLAGRELAKIRGGVLSSATAGGCSACRARLNTSVASGTRLTPMFASTAPMRCSKRAACAGSADGKRAATRRPSLRNTVRSESTVSVVKATSIVPRIGAFAPVGVMPITKRALSVRCSGHETTCGW
jgi:hypothetical protein